VERIILKYLLDTAPWLNGLAMPQVLPRRIQNILGSADTKYLCSISLLETAILHRLGRLELQGTLGQFFSATAAADLEIAELTPAIAAMTNELPEAFPGDPFDRTILATAAVLDLTLVTADSAMRDAEMCDVEYYPFKPTRLSR
jgi:PIN domain nuclease of toxin-antitoxin system